MKKLTLHNIQKKIQVTSAVAAVFSMALLPAGTHAWSYGTNSNNSTPTWSGFAAPESVIHDWKTDSYLVSNINGSPWDNADNNGYIAKARPDGGAVEKWIEGGRNNVTLNGPKGSAFMHETFWVADIDHVRGFDRNTGMPTANIAVAGSTFLNDVATDKKGNIYVTDTGMNPDRTPNGTDAIYRIDADSQSVTKISQGNQPNGIVYVHGKLVVGTRTGRLLVMEADTGAIVHEQAVEGAMLDGVQILPGGKVVTSNSAAANLIVFDKSGEQKILDPGVDLMTGAADFDIDYRRGRLVLPLLQSNQLVVSNTDLLGKKHHN